MDSSSGGGEDPCTTPQLQRMGSGGSSVVLDPETGAEAESRKLPSSQYKGVVPQPNGRWGAQIYEKHQRVWLGTFDSEPAAARSYDVAAQRFRGRDAVTNFKPLSASNPSDAAELEFLARRSKAEVVDMLRKHTYADELRQGRLTFSTDSIRDDRAAAQPTNGGGVGGASSSREHLFDKTVTPSDVGKLNRLVIPKQQAERHLPALRDGGRESALVSFEDAGDGKVWRFRYSYWNSSQSYVLTKGWSRFVKEKGLVAGDTVRFLRDRDVGGAERKLYVECRRGADGRERGGSAAKVVRLFGVDIFRGGGDEISMMVVKRKRDLDLDQVMGTSRFLKKKFVGLL